MNKSIVRTMLIVTLFILNSFQVNAEPYKVYTEALAPVHFEENGKVRGIATEIVEQIFLEAGLSCSISVYPWKRSYQMVLNQKDAFIYTINRTPKRETLFQWIGPILSKETHLYKLKSRKDIQLSDYEDARKYTTAVILGHSLTNKLLDNGFKEGTELVTTPNKKVQVKVFLKGRADLITGNQYTIHEALKAEGYSFEDAEPALFITSKGYYLGANIQTDQSIVDRLIAANARVQKSGIIPQIIAKYMH